MMELAPGGRVPAMPMPGTETRKLIVSGAEGAIIWSR